MSKLAMIHPDYLLDGARRSALAPEGWQELGAHLASCRACAFEPSVAADFERARRDGARALDAGHLDRLVDGALARANLVATEPQAGPNPSLPRSRAPIPRAEAPARAPTSGRPISTARWVAAAAVFAAAAFALVALGSGLSAHGDPSPAPPSEAALDAGAGAPLVGGDA